MIFAHVKPDKASFVRLLVLPNLGVRFIHRRKTMAALAQPLLTNSQLAPSHLPRFVERPRPSRLARLAATLRLWRGRLEQKRTLARLTSRELADFGASTADVYRELRTPFWRALPPC
jgi:uncharacterized protein YjiS (DUF1127 family)